MRWVALVFIVLGVGIGVFSLIHMKSMADNVSNPDWLGDNVKAIFAVLVAFFLVYAGLKLLGKHKK